MRNLSFMALSIAACIVLFACTTSSNNTVLPPAPSNPAPVIASNAVAANDAGDTLGVAKHWDIQTVQAQRIGPPGSTYTEIVVSIAFEKQTPNDGVADNTAFGSLPAPGTLATTASQLAGYILIDIDGNIATGLAFGCPGSASFGGVDFFVDFGENKPMLADGNAPVESTVPFGTQVGEAQISGGGNVVNATVKIANIGGSSSGPFNVGTAWGNGLSLSDCAPNAGYMADSVGRVPLSLGTSAAPGDLSGWALHP